MQLFLTFFVPGMLICWLYVRNRDSWMHTGIGIILGCVTAYGALYLMGNYVQAEIIADLSTTMGEALAVQLVNQLYGRALLGAVGAIIGCAIVLKIRNGRSSA